jgi:hypothetical protein
MTTYLEDLRPGSRYLWAGRTIRKEDITAFAGLSGDFSPPHTDDEWVRENTPFSARIAHGHLIFSISQGLRTPVIDDIAVIAFLGFERALVAPFTQATPSPRGGPCRNLAGRGPVGCQKSAWPVSCSDAPGSEVGHDDQPCPSVCRRSGVRIPLAPPGGLRVFVGALFTSGSW